MKKVLFLSILLSFVFSQGLTEYESIKDTERVTKLFDEVGENRLPKMSNADLIKNIQELKKEFRKFRDKAKIVSSIKLLEGKVQDNDITILRAEKRKKDIIISTTVIGSVLTIVFSGWVGYQIGRK